MNATTQAAEFNLEGEAVTSMTNSITTTGDFIITQGTGCDAVTLTAYGYADNALGCQTEFVATPGN